VSRPASPYIPLFWRLFVPNAVVLLGAGIVLTIEPANGRVVVLAAGLVVLLTVNLILMRRSFAPLARLAALMNRIDPLEPGRRLPTLGPASEVTRLTDAFNDMLDRLETERRDSALRALVAEAAERRRIAADLHDEVGQRLTALLLRLDRLRRLPPAEAAAEFDATAEAMKATLEVVRGLARRLRPEVLDELGLVPALRSLCDRIEKSTGLTVRRSLDPDLPPLSPDAELVAGRRRRRARGQRRRRRRQPGGGRGFRGRDQGNARTSAAHRRPARGRAGAGGRDGRPAPRPAARLTCRSGSSSPTTTRLSGPGCGGSSRTRST
jgi:two-component system, NarL family, sensor histidine kinase UhpB